MAIKKVKIKIGGVVKELGYDAEKLNGKSDSDFSLVGHDHDERYYTKTEIDTMIGDIETLLGGI